MPGTVAVAVVTSILKQIAGSGIFRHKKTRMFTGDIHLDTGKVDICRSQPNWCRKHKTKSALINSQLSAYLSGTGPRPKQPVLGYLVSVIDREKEKMRVRPLTPTEHNAWGQQTPAGRAIWPSRGRAPTRARRRKKKPVRVRRSAKRRSGKRARLVKGSAAAKRYMASIRRKRRA